MYGTNNKIKYNKNVNVTCINTYNNEIKMNKKWETCHPLSTSTNKVHFNFSFHVGIQAESGKM